MGARYEVMFRIAGGGMAEVFAGRVRGEAGFQKLVAIKRVLPHLAGEESIAAMFLDEARVAANIASPHVVQTLDLGRSDEGLPYLVMELVLGIDLGEVMRIATRQGKAVPIDVAVEIVAQAALGLHAAHEAKTPAGEPMHLVHRDISPQNVLVGADGRVRVTDFGIAWTALERLTQTSTGTHKGKYAYFSPEQSRRAKLDRRSDIFALGIVAWETLSGERLFAREDVIETITAIRETDVARLTEKRPDVAAEIDEVVRRALARDPDDRFVTARDFADAIRGAARTNHIEPSDAAVARWIAGLESPRLAQLAERLHQFARSPQVATLPDIEVTSDEIPAPTALPPAEDVAPKTIAEALPARRPWLLLAVAASLVAAAAIIAAATLGNEDPARAEVTPSAAQPSPPPPTPSPTPTPTPSPTPTPTPSPSPTLSPTPSPTPTPTPTPSPTPSPTPTPRTRRTPPRTADPAPSAPPFRPLGVDAFNRGAKRAPR